MSIDKNAPLASQGWSQQLSLLSTLKQAAHDSESSPGMPTPRSLQTFFVQSLASAAVRGRVRGKKEKRLGGSLYHHLTLQLFPNLPGFASILDVAYWRCQSIRRSISGMRLLQ